MELPSHEQHRAAARDRGALAVAVLTVSDSRVPESDASGGYLCQALSAAGHALADYRIVPDEPDRLREALDALAEGDARAVLINGGTGISRRDRTYGTLAAGLETTLPGFGELFRMLSWEQVGAAAMLSRALAGTWRGLLVFSMPGSPKAVQLAWERLIAPELAHLVWELDR
ncbi:MAG: molybdenum cofactor biosynthesis protein MoaB [Chloroflexi bacterium]|nr:molybdenum cofactor biosynthesis protein MoaB [Chloroflexota bacterium]